MGIEQLLRLKAAVASMESLAAVGEDFIEADKDFHRTFFELLGSQLLSNPPGAFRDAYYTLHTSIGIKTNPISISLRPPRQTATPSRR